MVHPIPIIISRQRVPKNVTLHHDKANDSIRVLRGAMHIGDITRREIEERNGNIDTLLVRLLS